MPRRDLDVDRLPGSGPSLEVVRISGASFGAAAARGPRAPHRHDYHELVWTRSGTGRHLVDGEPAPIEERTVTVIPRGRVHVLDEGRDVHGAVVRFGDELLGGAAGQAGWLVGGRGARSVEVPEGDVDRLEAAIDALAAEARRPPDARTAALERHLLAALLLWVERWHDDGRSPDRPAATDPAERLHRRFAELLERDFARHGDARHYADALRVPQAALSRALTAATGRTTKELVTDRRMTEAARLLRFSDLSVGEIAHRAGFADQLYFSRAFKRRHGEAPVAYRERVRGAGG